MKKTRGKILTKNDVESIELMLKKGFNLADYRVQRYHGGPRP